MDTAPRSIRWRELRLAALGAVLFGAAAALLMPGVWPLMPFPAPAPVEIAALLGFGLGFVLRRMWVLVLPVTVLVALDPPQSGFGGSLIALLVLWPFAAAGGALGVACGRWLKRRVLRRTLRAAKRPQRLTPPSADSPIRATRQERTPAARAGS
jgi:hypothetical protein